jgi:pimeloyl-ACP methyl ester carboxylesterase
LVLLHGLGSNARIWDRLATALPGLPLLALDQRAHGFSADGSLPGAGDFVADAAALIEAAGLGPAVVAGHSWGAATALQVATARPDLVAGLALIDGAGGSLAEVISWEHMVAELPAQAHFQSEEDAVAAGAAALGGAWGDDLLDFARAGLVQGASGFAPALSPAARLGILRHLHGFRPEALHPQVGIPALVAVAGEGTGWWVRVMRAGARRAVQVMPAARLSFYRCGHDIPLFAPGRLAAELHSLRDRAAAGVDLRAAI